MTPATASLPDHPFLDAVRDFCHLIYSLDKINEAKVAAFIFESGLYKNDDGSWEFGEFKKITLDEFVKGRKRKDGKRFNAGCNISDPGNASRALHGLEQQGKTSIKTDARDGARRKNFFRLTLPSLQSCQSNNIRNQASTDTRSNVVDVTTFQNKRDSNPRMNVVKVTTPICQSNNPDLLNQQIDQSIDSSKELKEETSIAPDAPANLDVALSARTADAAQGETYSALREKEESEAERLRAKIDELEAAYAKEKRHKEQIDLRIRIRVLQRTLDELLASSHSRTPPAHTASAQQEAFAARWLSEQQHIRIETTTTTLDAPTPLFPDAVPPPKISLEKEVGSWFYDWEHVSERNRRRVNIALEALKKQGYTTLEQLRAAYESWRFTFHDMRRKSVMHFADHAGALPQC